MLTKPKNETIDYAFTTVIQDSNATPVATISLSRKGNEISIVCTCDEGLPVANASDITDNIGTIADTISKLIKKAVECVTLQAISGS